MIPSNNTMNWVKSSFTSKTQNYSTAVQTQTEVECSAADNKGVYSGSCLCSCPCTNSSECDSHPSYPLMIANKIDWHENMREDWKPHKRHFVICEVTHSINSQYTNNTTFHLIYT